MPSGINLADGAKYWEQRYSRKVRKRNRSKRIAMIVTVMILLSMLSGCGTNTAAKEDAETITVYMWSTALYESYAPYIQS